MKDMPIIQQGSSAITSSNSSLLDSMDRKRIPEESLYSFNSKYVFISVLFPNSRLKLVTSVYSFTEIGTRD